MPEAEVSKFSKRACSPAGLPEELSTREPSEGDSDASEAVSGLTIFDWDDTLCPTTSMGISEQLLGVDGTLRLHRGSLQQHAKAVEALLRAATAVSNVCIVTLAERGWVELSAQLYLPCLNLAELLKELSVPIYHAREMLPSVAFDSESLEICKGMKMAAIVQALIDAKSKAAPSLNLVSVGASLIERLAVRELVSMWTGAGLEPTGKTLTLVQQPSVQLLTFELKGILPCIGSLHAHEEHLDMEPFAFEAGLCRSFATLHVGRSESREGESEG